MRFGQLLKYLPKNCFYTLALLFLSGCSNQQDLTPLEADSTILSFGDSLTFGVGAKSGQSYPDVLSELTGIKVVNAGISGETTTQGIKRFQAMLDTHRPQLVILMQGGNDILRNHSRQQTRDNLASMITMARAQSVELVLIGVPEKKLFSDSAPLYAELAESFDLVFIEDMLADLLRTRAYKSDPIHLNAAGYRKLAEHLYETLQESGAIN